MQLGLSSGQDRSVYARVMENFAVFQPHRIRSLTLRKFPICLLSTICAFVLAPAAVGQQPEGSGDQATANSLAGRYSLAGVMETAAQLQLAADGSYKWVLMVGNLDLYSEGRWTQADGQVVLGPHRFGNDRPVFALGASYPWGDEERESAHGRDMIRLQNRAKWQCAFLDNGGYYASSGAPISQEDMTPAQRYEVAVASEQELRAAYEQAIDAYFARDRSDPDDSLEVSARTARRNWGHAVAVLAKSARAVGKTARYQPPSLPADCFFLSDYRPEYAGDQTGPWIDWRDGVGIWVNRRERPDARLDIDAAFTFADGGVETASSHELGFAFVPATANRQLKAISLILRHDGGEYSSRFELAPDPDARVHEVKLDRRVLIKPPFEQLRLNISGDRLVPADGSGGAYIRRD
ncbi:hypothetical protein [Sphingorhabdus sp. 109]|jgi:hypothetical protein|uniref:hypothetical protein n=1 Tax=Sphingorhabdus sp. 109 TaxID=2653173 RepID=UPI0012F32EC1|nr:hypothetical protein [Sphingorhabdus sp. 109]VWX61109.1 hypothetical protein SPHINGOR109_51011 [Sphingorhabdus sp. 109]